MFFDNFRCTCLGFNTFLSSSVVLVLIESVLHQHFGCLSGLLHQCFGCSSGLHLNLTKLVEILGEILKEFDLSQMRPCLLVDSFSYTAFVMFKHFPMYRSTCCIHTFFNFLFLTMSSMTQPDFASVLFPDFLIFYYRVDLHQWP